MSRTGAIAASAPVAAGAVGPSYYFHGDDAVNDGAGKVASLACRITGAVASANVAGNKPTRNTVFKAGKITIQNTANTHNLTATITGTWNSKQPTSAVARVYIVTPQANTHFMAINRAAATSTAQRFLQNSGGGINYRQAYFRGGGTSGASATVTHPAETPSGTWLTLGWSYGATTDQVQFFQQGALQSSTTIDTFTSIVNPIDRIWLGNYASLIGLIGHWGIMRLFNRALTAAEHAAEHALCVAEGYA